MDESDVTGVNLSRQSDQTWQHQTVPCHHVAIAVNSIHILVVAVVIIVQTSRYLICPSRFFLSSSMSTLSRRRIRRKKIMDPDHGFCT